MSREIIWRPQPGPQMRFFRCGVPEIFYGGARGGGKGQPLDEPVLTPFGWRPIGDLDVGNQVCNPDGSVSRIIAVFRRGKQPVYKLTFSDGSWTRCDADHIWLGHFVGGHIKRNISDKLWTFREILRRYGDNKDARFIIPLTQPVRFTRPCRNRYGDLMPVDPYLLGLLLGDGGLTGGSIRLANPDSGIIRWVSERYKVTGGEDGLNWRIVDCPDLRDGLQKLGVWGKRSEGKFIPESYKWASENVRLAVLQGLMDTDGTASKDGKCYYSSSSRRLAEDVQFIARSLGFKATLTTKHTPCLDSHTVYLNGLDRGRLFRLEPHKKARAAQDYQPQHCCRRLVSIEPLGEMETVCISVDNPNGLYLTRDFIVTHNTASLLLHWVRHAHQFGNRAVGVLFRRTFPELEEVVRQAGGIYPKLGAVYRKADKLWEFPNGARLYLRYLERDEDAERYQGHQYNWMAFDELTNWARPEPIDRLRACWRSAEGVRKWFLATGNPGGVGHAWVKARYVDPAEPGTAFVGEDGQRRIFIPAKVTDNKILLQNDPGYIDALKASGPDWLVRAWLEGDWDVAAGSYLEGVWSKERHVIPARQLPPTWKRWRSMDWGYAAPYAVLWFAVDYDGIVHVYREDYGASGPNKGVRKTPAEVAERIKRAEQPEARAGIKVGPNYADPAIFATQDGNQSIGDQFHRAGVPWVPADHRPGSRVNGAQVIVQMLKERRLRIHDCCKHLIECLATIPPDPHNAEDVDTRSEDHLWDALRYGLMPYMTASRRPEADTRPKPGTFDWHFEGY